MDFKQKVNDVERLLQKKEFTSAARESVITIEQTLRQLYNRNQERVDKTVRHKVQEALQKRGRKEIDQLTMGQLVYVFQESEFLDASARVLGKDLSSLQIIDLKKLTHLRNKVMHEAREATRAEAEFLFNCLNVILETFDLIDFGYTEEKETLKESEMDANRRKEKIQTLLEEYDLLNEQVTKLRKARIIETDPATLFKLEKQIEQAEEELMKLEQKIEALKTSKQDTEAQQPTTGKYNVQIAGNVKGLVQGDNANVTMTFNE